MEKMDTESQAQHDFGLAPTPWFLVGDLGTPSWMQRPGNKRLGRPNTWGSLEAMEDLG